MYTSLLVAFNSVFPMFFIIMLGYFVRRKNMIEAKGLSDFNNIAFRIFLPCQLFKNIFDSELSQSFDLKLVLLAVIGVLFTFFLSLASVLPMEKEAPRRGVMMQAMFRSNFIILGIPLFSSVSGSEQLGFVPVMIAIIVPMFNVLSVVTLELFRNSKVNMGKIFWGIISNPLILGSAVGVIAKLIHFPLYEISIFGAVVDSLAKIATPLMLFILGASFRLSSIQTMKKHILFCCFGKLILNPAIMFALAALLHINGAGFAMLLGIFATPPAANSYNMALQMGGDADLAANLVVIGTLISCFTMFFWILLLKQTGLL